jgi:hypothetical protein
METYTEDSKLDNSASVYTLLCRVCIIRFPHHSRYLFSSSQLVRAQSQSSHWLIPILNRLLQPQQDQPSPPPPPTTLPAPVPPPPPPPSAAAVPACPAPPKRPPQPQLQEDAVAKLLEDNDDVFDRLINHPFPRALGDGSASLDGFRYYMIVSHS